jgi:CheY-like chemotaxis protein
MISTEFGMPSKLPRIVVVKDDPSVSLAFYRLLHLSGKKKVAIFITAHDEPSVREEAKRLGPVAYLPKPFSGRTLLAAVNQALSFI